MQTFVCSTAPNEQKKLEIGMEVVDTGTFYFTPEQWWGEDEKTNLSLITRNVMLNTYQILRISYEWKVEIFRLLIHDPEKKIPVIY